MSAQKIERAVGTFPHSHIFGIHRECGSNAGDESKAPRPMSAARLQGYIAEVAGK